MIKICSKCGVSKELASFSKWKHGKDGLKTQCKACDKLYYDGREKQNKAYRKKHAAKMKAYNHDWYKNNKERAKLIRQKYRETHIEEIKEIIKLWTKNNPERVRTNKVRRRMRERMFVSELDAKKSTLHRKRIKDNPCFYCGNKKEEMHDDHYYPLSRGGTDHWFNIVRACKDCNLAKSDLLVGEWVAATVASVTFRTLPKQS